MFFQCSTEPLTIDSNILKKFIKTCYWRYLHKYDLLGHHNLGWGFAYIDEHKNNSLIIKRDINPIYHSDWKKLTDIKTRFLLIHARKAKPWNKSFNNIHPINIHEKYLIAHNGIIKSFLDDKLDNPKLEIINNNTILDTRKYLCHIIDKIQKDYTLKESLELLFKRIIIGAGANAFLFNSKECHVINYHNTNFNGRHHTLFINKDKTSIFVSTTPIKAKAKEIENNSLISIDLKALGIKFYSLSL
jgi:predicted glutamine amidotransferase